MWEGEREKVSRVSKDIKGKETQLVLATVGAEPLILCEVSKVAARCAAREAEPEERHGGGCSLSPLLWPRSFCLGQGPLQEALPPALSSD